jgi:hypothetical protein
LTTTIEVRILKGTGIAAFRGYLESLGDEGGSTPPPFELLEDEAYTTKLGISAAIDPGRTFVNKLEFGRYLAERLEALRSDPALERDAGLWSWLALCFFDQLCPTRPDGSRKPRAEYSYILSQDYKHHYRHLVRTPCLAYALHGEHARVVLSGPLHTHGEASEQLLSREHVLTNKPLFEAMDRLYVKAGPDGSYHLKPGSRSKVGGSMRRLGKIVRQFDLTYDLRAMTVGRIFDLLPGEFDRFKQET